MDDEWSDELRMLRARAYGPAADILEDPTALARLRELEGRAQTAVTPPLDPAPAARHSTAGLNGADSPVDNAPYPDRPNTETVVVDAEPGAAASVPENSTTDSATTVDAPPRQGRRLWPWIAAVGGVGLVVGAVLATVIPALPGNRVAVLRAVDAADWNTDIFGPLRDGSVAFDDFHDVAVVMIPDAWGQTGADPASECVFIHSDNGMILTMACAGDGFPATASFTVTSTASEKLREEFPEGTSLQFVLDGSEVSVYARRP